VAMNSERIFKLRLVVARFGEMDGAGWWNTNGVLTRLGNTVFSRGFPRTDFFAQAKVAFEVARFRCREIFNPPDSVTLWDLPLEVEEAIDNDWPRWCASRDHWEQFFVQLQGTDSDDLFATFTRTGLVAADCRDSIKKLKKGPEGRSVPVAGNKPLDDELIDLLAMGFCKGAKGELLVPYAAGVGVPHL